MMPAGFIGGFGGSVCLVHDEEASSVSCETHAVVSCGQNDARVPWKALHCKMSGTRALPCVIKTSYIANEDIAGFL